MSFAHCVTARSVPFCVPLLRFKSDRRAATLHHGLVRPCTWCGGMSEFRDARVAGDTLPSEPAWTCLAAQCGSLEFVRHDREAGAASIVLWSHGRWSCQLVRGRSEVLLLAHASAVLTRVCSLRAEVDRAALRFQVIAQLADARRSVDSLA